MAGQLGGVPVLILKEGTGRTRGKDAVGANIMAARVVAEAVRTALGPRGLDKMMVDSLGDVSITNDGATILDKMDVQHPAAKMMVQVAKTQDQEVGDGTTTAVVLAGELLRKAEELLDKQIHPSIVVSGYKKLEKKCDELLEQVSIKIDPEDMETMKKTVMTSLNSKSVSGVKEYFAEISVKAIKTIVEEKDGKLEADIDKVSIIKKQGKGLDETELVDGIIVDKEVVHPGMPKLVKNAKVALISGNIEIEKTEFDAEIRISSPDQMKAFMDEERHLIQEMVGKIINTGATVVIAQKGIDDIAQHAMAKAGILAVRRVKKSDIEKMEKATGATIVSSINDLGLENIGAANHVEEVKIGEDKLVFVRECPHAKAVSILIRGGAQHIIDEAERSIHDALSVARDILEDGYAVAGGGASFIELSQKLMSYAEGIKGKEQLAMMAFAEALEVIPKTLAENAGLDPIDILAELRAKHEEGGKTYGIDVLSAKVRDMTEIGVLEPLRIVKQAIKSATEAAVMVLRIDDIIAAKHAEAGAPPAGAMPGGHGPPGIY